MGEKMNAYRLLVGKPRGKTLLGGQRSRWIILGWILERGGWNDIDGVGVAQDRSRWRAFVNSVLNLWDP
jgi:hypothetical protein